MNLTEIHLTPIMDEYWENLSMTREENEIHPSSLSSLCLREYYHILAKEWIRPEPPIPSKRLLVRAQTIHKEMQSIWKSLGILEGEWKCLCCNDIFYKNNPLDCTCGSTELEYLEVSLENKELNMKGKADAILRVDGKTGFGEIKTINSYKFSRLIEPERKHVFQVNCYFLMSHLDTCWIYYTDRDNGNYKIFQIQKDEKIIEEITLKSKLLLGCLDNKIPPPLNFDQGNNYCKKYCVCSEICKKKTQGVEEWMKDSLTS